MIKTTKTNLFILLGVLFFCFLGFGSSNNSSSSSSSYNSKSSSYSDSSSSSISNAPDGTTWNTLTQSEKETLVKKYLTNLKNNGYTINRSISWFVDCLDAYYNDNSGATNSTKVPEVISLAGVADNAISK